jgi:hypothetical protein
LVFGLCLALAELLSYIYFGTLLVSPVSFLFKKVSFTTQLAWSLDLISYAFYIFVLFPFGFFLFRKKIDWDEYLNEPVLLKGEAILWAKDRTWSANKLKDMIRVEKSTFLIFNIAFFGSAGLCLMATYELHISNPYFCLIGFGIFEACATVTLRVGYF